MGRRNASAAVIGIPHDDLGEEIGAAVVLRPGAEATTDDIKAFVKSRVAGYKYPRSVWFLDSLPKGPSGKVLRREIKPPAPVEVPSAR
jgi:long-chain acyl-CoA synthetase